MPSADIVITVTPQYLEEHSKPEKQQFLFAYKINITNKSRHAVQLISRHWIITDADQNTEEVRGLGVVGKQPLIAAGSSFEYSSGCPLPTSFGTMKGEFHFVGENGIPFDVAIDEFVLAIPRTLH